MGSKVGDGGMEGGEVGEQGTWRMAGEELGEQRGGSGMAGREVGSRGRHRW